MERTIIKGRRRRWILGGGSHGVLQRRVAGARRNPHEVPERREANAGGPHLLRVRIGAIPCAGLGVGPGERVPVDIDAVAVPRGGAVDGPAGVHAAGGEEDVPQVRGGGGAGQGRVRADAEAQLLGPGPAQGSCQGCEAGVAAAVRRPRVAAEAPAGEPRLLRRHQARVQPPRPLLRQQDAGEDQRCFPHAVPGRHGHRRGHLLLPGAAGRRERVREGAEVQLVGHPAAGAAGGVRAPPHHQRRLRLLRHLGAAREAEEGRQNGVDPAQLPGLRQVPYQVHPKLHSEQDEKAAGELGRGNPKCEAKGRQRKEEITSEEEEQEKAVQPRQGQEAAEGFQVRHRRDKAAPAEDQSESSGPVQAVLRRAQARYEEA